MSTKPKPVCETVMPWLRANLGKRCLAPLTGCDWRALKAAAQIIDLYCYCPNPAVAQSFGLVVSQMQEATRELAYHAVAHVMNWEDRSRLWIEAGLEPISAGVCAFEPGGSQKEAA